MPDSTRSPRFQRYAMPGLAIWMIAMIFALSLDTQVAQWVAAHHPINKSSVLIEAMKLPGVYWTTLGIAALLFCFHRQHVRAALLPLIGGAMGGLGYQLLKWIVGRRRPVIVIAPFHFQPFIGGWRGLFHQSGLCFPSGHASLSFATAAALTILLPRWRVVWFSIAVLVGAERVLENAHYLSDVVGGAGLGVFSTLLAQNLLKRYCPADQTARVREFPEDK